MQPVDFLTLTSPILDVRSPGEYTQAHIPGAVSFPLFNDEERAEVGTLYKQVGKQEAFERGLEIVGPKMAGFVREARGVAANHGNHLRVHCWRGGQRSGSMAWLLRSAGIEITTLSGGYKNYRQHVLDSFATPRLSLVVLGGHTGSGKTKVLRALRDLGEQVLDLEALAHHKGSAFGAIGETEQPTVEQFENDLHAALSTFDPLRRVWVENESKSIGRVFLPLTFWAQKNAAPLVNLEIPHPTRLANLVADYAPEDRELLAGAFRRIEKRLGGQHLKAALAALDRGDFAAAAEVALVYYDKTYEHCLTESKAVRTHHLKFDTGDPRVIAQALAGQSF